MYPPCNLCNNTTYSKFTSVSNANFSTYIKDYDIIICNKCHLARMHPFPTNRDIEEIYVYENTFSLPFDNPNKNSLLFDVLEPLYQWYGADFRFIAKTCINLSTKKNNASVLKKFWRKLIIVKPLLRHYTRSP